MPALFVKGECKQNVTKVGCSEEGWMGESNHSRVACKVLV